MEGRHDLLAYVAENITTYLPEELKHFNVRIIKDNGINENLVFLLFEDPKGEHIITPRFYEDFVLHIINSSYSEEEFMSTLATMFVAELEKGKRYTARIEEIKRGENIEIIPELIPYEVNEDLLKSIPHRRVLDLAIIYRIPCLDGTISVTNHLAELNLKMTEEELYEKAIQNVQIEIEPMAQVLEGRLEDEAVEECANNLFVVSNAKKLYGANALLKPEVLAEFARQMDSDFIIIPSSVHEVILRPVAGDLVEELELCKEQVEIVNYTQVPENEILSNSPYYLLKDEGVIRKMKEVYENGNS